MPENDISIRIKGLDKLKVAFDRMPYEIAKAGMREALGAGGAVLRDEARALAPVGETGDLKRSVGMKITLGNNLDKNIVSVGPRYTKKTKAGKRSPGIYGLFVEIGTSKMPATPWLRPALSSARDRAVKAFADSLRATVQKVAAALGKR